MLTFLECIQAGHTKDKELIFGMIAADGKRYEFAITTDCFLRLFAMGWKAAQGLGPGPTSGETPALDATAQFAILNMQPALTLSSGPLVLAVPVSEQLLTILQDGMRSISEMDKGSQH
jgi:hypothetical protein